MAEAERERTRYEEIVRNAAWLVHDGVVAMDEIAVPVEFREDDNEREVTDEELREDVREYLPKVEAADPKTKVNEREPQQSASELDWGALWDEFDIASPDAVGFCGASTTQLRLAIDCTDQGVNVAPPAAIQDALERGEIIEVTTPDKHGREVTRGYCRPGGEA